MEEESSIKSYDGSVSVGRDAVVGGNVRVSGSQRVAHNLKVEGWLEAPNVKGAQLGLFLTAAQLNAAYPSPKPGQWALVLGQDASEPETAACGCERSFPAEIWMNQGGVWQNTGRSAGYIRIADKVAEAEIEALNERVDGQEAELGVLRTDLTGAQEAIDALDGSLSTLTLDVEALGTRLDKETETRQSHDNDLVHRISSLSAKLEEVKQEAEDKSYVDGKVAEVKNDIKGLCVDIQDATDKIDDHIADAGVHWSEDKMTLAELRQGLGDCKAAGDALGGQVLELRGYVSDVMGALGSTARIVPFDGFYVEGGVEGLPGVRFRRSTGSFVFGPIMIGGAKIDRSLYQDKAGVPHTDRFYTSGGEIYCYSGGAMVCLSDLADRSARIETRVEALEKPVVITKSQYEALGDSFDAQKIYYIKDDTKLQVK